MNETPAPAVNDPVNNVDSELPIRLDAFARGECSEDEFVVEISNLLQAAPAPDSAWNMLNMIDQRHRRGEIPVELFRSIESQIVGRVLANDSYTTITDLHTGLTKRPSPSLDDPPAYPPVEIGRVLRDRYVLEKRLGSGGIGTVFKALDRYRSDLPEANQYVAVKVLHERADSRAERLADLRRAFYRAQMLSHRNIVNAYEMDRDGDVDFFTMELLEGELLSSVMGRLHPAPMSRPYAWAIIRQLGSGLAHAHRHNEIHGDLKPHNIMITNAGEVRILGFGASSTSAGQRPEDVPRHQSTLSAAMSAYASCELLAGRPADPCDDIYALACISYELLAGTHPFQRRRSTEARDLGIVPKRPPGLNRQQWQTLAMGLSWHRAARSISVRAWLDKLNAGRAAAEQLPCARDLKPASAKPRPTVPLRATTLFVALLITVTAWVSFIRMAPGGKSAGNDVVPAAAAINQFITYPAINDSAVPDGTPLADFASFQNAPPQGTQLQSPEAQSQVSNNMRRDSNRPPKLPTEFPNPIVVSAPNYKIRPGENFAEIRVHRSSRLDDDAAFVWWTEAASAKPGIDYVHQGKATLSIPKGKRSATFFIKLVPNASRAQSEVFYIAIAEAGRGSSLGQIAHAAIWLPTTRDQS
jgi:serine/threonine protein kinase